MRWVGALLVMFGVVTIAAGLVVSAGAIFGGRDRHAMREKKLVLDTTEQHRFALEPGNRYALAVSVLVDRGGLPIDVDAESTAGPVFVVAGTFPVEVTATDASGQPLAAKATGSFTPQQSGVTVFGRAQAADGPIEIEKYVGALTTAGKQEITVTTRVGRDTSGTMKATGALVRVYDDRLPRAAVAGMWAIGVGALSFVIGLVALVLGGRRKKRDRA